MKGLIVMGALLDAAAAGGLATVANAAGLSWRRAFSGTIGAPILNPDPQTTATSPIRILNFMVLDKRNVSVVLFTLDSPCPFVIYFEGNLKTLVAPMAPGTISGSERGN